MNDRGEKIITLAREMLRADVIFEDVAPQEAKATISFKILCLATVLTAVGSSAVTAWSDKNHRPLTHYEKTELNALVFYTARIKGQDESAVRYEVESKFGISSFDDLTREDFVVARHYLQEKAQ